LNCCYSTTSKYVERQLINM